MWSPTSDERAMVSAMAGYGMPAADIARVVAKGVPESEFLKVCSGDLEEGQIHANAKLAEQLYTQAVNGNTAALLHLSRQSSGGTLPAICTTSEMCSWLGISKVALHDMRKRGVCEMVSRDRWNCKQTVQAVMRHYRDVSAGRKSGADTPDAPDLVTERALLARAQREGVEMANEVERGNLMYRDDVVSVVGSIAIPIARELETIPDRLERDMRVTVDVVDYVRNVIRAARESMARTINELRRSAV